MGYIRTKDSVIEFWSANSEEYITKRFGAIPAKSVVKESERLEDLFDEILVEEFPDYSLSFPDLEKALKRKKEIEESEKGDCHPMVYGAIFTGRYWKPVAVMLLDGGFELL